MNGVFYKYYANGNDKSKLNINTKNKPVTQ